MRPKAARRGGPLSTIRRAASNLFIELNLRAVFLQRATAGRTDHTASARVVDWPPQAAKARFRLRLHDKPLSWERCIKKQLFVGSLNPRQSAATAQGLTGREMAGFLGKPPAEL